jgi:hypothetical protein
MQGFEVKRRGELKLIKVFQVSDREQEVASKTRNGIPDTLQTPICQLWQL